MTFRPASGNDVFACNFVHLSSCAPSSVDIRVRLKPGRFDFEFASDGCPVAFIGTNRKWNLPRQMTAYYQPVPVPEADLTLVRRIGELHLRWPFPGSRKLRDQLQKEGFAMGRKHVATLMKMGIAALYRKPRTSNPGTGHRIYPYLLRKLVIDRPSQVWATDIAYIPMAKGFVYLAILDRASRRVPARRTSNWPDDA